jgi:hypothetical protein
LRTAAKAVIAVELLGAIKIHIPNAFLIQWVNFSFFNLGAIR